MTLANFNLGFPSEPSNSQRQVEAKAPRVIRHGRFFVVRDDLFLGGTKARVLRQLVPKIQNSEIVYAGHAYGFGQLALAITCHEAGKKLKLIIPRPPETPKVLLETMSYECVSVEFIDSIHQSDAHKIAVDYSKRNLAYLFPIGFRSEKFLELIGEIAQSLPIDRPSEVWTLGGSGTLALALKRTWPDANINVVNMGFQHAMFPECKVYTTDLTPNESAKELPPYNSCLEYDAKIWEFASRYGKIGSLIWNVA